ncbi:MAG: PIN domain-containing protein [Thermodesulfovibrionales bacterium]|nr:PIN domain-containing protein [Thermodesulfovibrionales bacterium]
MLKHLARIFVVAIFMTAGYLYGLKYGYVTYGAITGFSFGVITIFVESRLKKISFGSVLGGLFGLGTGLVFANLFLLPFRYVITDETKVLVYFVLNAAFGYGGLFVGLHRGRNLTVSAIMRLFKGQELEEDIKVLDTSVIIDGRIADIIEAGFLEGAFIIPQFILQELQYIADSPDPLRRTKGRRGLDILHRIQKMSNIKVKIVEEDFPKIKEVDAKLIALARLLSAKIITNDFNLNKVAQLQGVAVLNINELANVLKPVVLPGESLNLFIVKEGKEYNQGVAYLDDGTMVVIENARRLIGKNVEVVVASVLQTTAGRMIFAKPKEEE